MTDERRQQIAWNESMFRAINETSDEDPRKVRSVHGDLAEFICECGHAECRKLVYVSLRKYEEVRADPRRFLLAPGHDIEGVEDVVEQGQRYAVVEKHADVNDIVEATDTRRR